MKRTEIESEFTVDDNGIIQDMGKFENEPIYTVYFWDMSMNGFCNDVQYDGDTPFDYYDITEEDIAEFPELAGHKRIAVWESDSGFVNSELDPEDMPDGANYESDDSDIYCPKCGFAWNTHNDDGSCVEDTETKETV